MVERRPILVMLHVPKTAGTSLRTVLIRQYDPARTYETRDRWPLGDAPAQLEAGLPPDVELVHGHMQFGIHAHLPREATYAVMLRDPVERVISSYHYLLRRSPERHPHLPVYQRLSLEEYVRDGVTADIDNLQTRFVSGELAALGQMTPAMLERAKGNLASSFAVAGLAERFDESLLLMARTLGWRRPLYYDRRNVTRDRPARAQVTPDSLALIERYNRLDQELYDFARERFERQVRDAGRALEREVAAFRRRNRLVGRLLSVRRRFREGGAPRTRPGSSGRVAGNG